MKLLPLLFVIILAMSTFIVQAKDDEPKSIEDKALLIECHEKYQQIIRERTGSLSMQLKQKVAARSKLIDKELKKDETYKDEVALLKEEKKNFIKQPITLNYRVNFFFFYLFSLLSSLFFC